MVDELQSNLRLNLKMRSSGEVLRAPTTTLLQVVLRNLAISRMGSASSTYAHSASTTPLPLMPIQKPIVEIK